MTTKKRTGLYRRTMRAAERNVDHDVISRRALQVLVLSRAQRLKLDTRNDLGAFLNEAPSQISRLATGHVGEFSVERLVRYLLQLGCGITLSVKMPDDGRRHKVRRPRARVIVA